MKSKHLLLIGLIVFSAVKALGQVKDTLSIEIDEKIQVEAYEEYRGLNDSITVLKANLLIAQQELEKLKNDIESDNIDRNTINTIIDKQIEELKTLQHKSFNNLKHVLGRMSSASDVTNNLARTWVSGISLSRTVENPFSNSVVQNKWDKFANTAKWLPALLFTGYSFATEQSTENKLGSLAIGVSITGLVDIIQNVSKKDGVNTTQNLLEEGGVAIEVISIYRAGYDDLNEIITYLNNYQKFMKDKSDAFKAWYDKLEKDKVFEMTESELDTSSYWVDATFIEAQIHLENNQKRMEYYYNIFTRVDLLITSKMSNQLFSRYAKPGSPPDSLLFIEECPEMLTELYNNLSNLRKTLNADEKSWEALRKRYYTLRPSELDAITSWIDLKAEIARLELSKK